MRPDEKQLNQAKHFAALHSGTEVLLLPCAWDTSSAKVFELAGFSAIGTTSAGISASLGYSDGQRMSLTQNLAVAGSIGDCIDLPLSMDIEAGYSRNPAGVAAASRKVIQAGAVGLNIEDGFGGAEGLLADVTLQKEIIAAIRAMADDIGFPLFINARTDIWLHSGIPESQRMSEAIARANHYLEAGADGIFVPDMGDLERATIAGLAREIDAPINLIAGASTPPVDELGDLGVARLSLGPRPMRACLGFLSRMSNELLTHGTYRLMTSDAPSYGEVNDWFDRRAITGNGE
jgi:2-methylisocitrate lyase-like PEP mutase family enzyme